MEEALMFMSGAALTAFILMNTDCRFWAMLISVLAAGAAIALHVHGVQ